MAPSARSHAPEAAVELRGRMATLTVLRLLSTDRGELERDLRAKIAQAPRMLRGSPVVLDLALHPETDARQLATWVDVIRRVDLVPVGVSNVTPTSEASARSLELGVFPDFLSSPPQRAETPPGGTEDGAEPRRFSPSQVVRQPVRSGQQIYARNRDLIVLASVSPGAELMADGNIHVYGTLRGRALAGVQGYEEARILCQSLQAELVSVAGWYKLSDEMGGWDGPVQIFLEGEELSISAL